MRRTSLSIMVDGWSWIPFCGLLHTVWMVAVTMAPQMSNSQSTVRQGDLRMRRWFRLIISIALLLSVSKPVTGWIVSTASCYEKRRFSRRLVRSSSDDTALVADEAYYTRLDEDYGTSRSSITLTRYLDDAVKEEPNLASLQSLVLAVQNACKTISNVVNRAGLVRTQTLEDGRYFSMKRLDQLSTIILKNALLYTGQCEVVKPPRPDDNVHRPGVLIAKSLDSTNSTLACILDPLDGSGNADASIGTGTIFGIYENHDENLDLVDAVLKPGRTMRAAGYCLYSSATVLVLSINESVQSFTLNPQRNEFVLTNPDLKIPKRGMIYSCNEANSLGWEESFNAYLRKLKTGTGQSKQKYALRYVGSMVADLHRTLLYGGIFCYPADPHHPEGNLQLLYKTAPLAVLFERAGGKTTNGKGSSLLDLQPEFLHQKSPCFLGSPDDVQELEDHLKRSDQ